MVEKKREKNELITLVVVLLVWDTRRVQTIYLVRIIV